MNNEVFEERCMDIIIDIVSLDIKQERQGAICVSRKMLDKAKEKGSKVAIKIYERVLEEFEIASDDDYDMLRKQIFK